MFLQFVLHIADNGTVEEVDGALGAGRIPLGVGYDNDGCGCVVELLKQPHDLLAVL